MSDEDDDSDEKPLSSEDLVRTAEQINIESHAVADLGQDDDSVLWSLYIIYINIIVFKKL